MTSGYPSSILDPRRGTTLTEVMVASALLALSIVPLLKALTTAHVMDRVIERKSWSLLLAQRELETIQARSACRYGESLAVDSRTLEDGYLCRVTDEPHATLEMRTVTVSVGFDDNGDGVLSKAEVQVSLCTLMARRG